MKKLCCKFGLLFAFLATCLLIGVTEGKTIAQKDAQLPVNHFGGAEACTPRSPAGIIYVTDSNWSTDSETSDCAQGWANDEWRLTLSQPKTVRLNVDDCCCPGDYYSVYVDGNLIGTTPKPSVWGCNFTGYLSAGTFETLLPAGTHTIKIRDVSFADHTAQQIAYERMCPAGFTLEGTLLAPPALPDVSLSATSWEFDNSTSPYRPEKFWLSVTARNLGTAAANNTVVRFYLGNPDQGGSQIGSAQALGTIQPGGQARATAEWTLSGNVENATLYARVSANSDTNAANNTTNQAVSVWYVPFQHDQDAYSFDNWSLEWADIKNDFLLFLDVNHPDDLLPAIIYPVTFPIWSMLLESGGHCYGMAAASSLYYQFPSIKPLPKSTFAMTRDEARADIQNYHRTQTTHILEAAMMRNFGSNAEAGYNTVRNSIRDQHMPIMLLMQTEAGGHAVVANKVLELGDVKRIYLYDNNLPLSDMNSSLYATVDTKDKTFLFDSPYGHDFDRFLAKPALLTWPDHAEVILEQFYNWALSEIFRGDLIRVSFGPSLGSGLANQASEMAPPLDASALADPLITDQYGRRAGYINGSQVNEIPGATLSTWGDQRVIDLPADLQYVVGVNGAASANIALSILIPERDDAVREVGYFAIPTVAGSSATVQVRKGNTDWTLINSGQPAQQPDRLEDTTFHLSFMPSVQVGNVCGSQMINNPGFEQGMEAGWLKSSTNGRNLIYSSGFPSPVAPRSGSWSAWLGNAHNEVATLSQTINPPESATSATLTYWYWIDSAEGACTYDHAWVELNGGLLRLHDLCSSGNTYGWEQASVDLTPYLGQPLNLRFYTDTDGSVTSHFFLDDVTLGIECSE